LAKSIVVLNKSEIEENSEEELDIKHQGVDDIDIEDSEEKELLR
jgi:hypothetical protein